MSYLEKQKPKWNAEYLARQNIPLKQYCEKCGSINNLVRHHPNYSKPLEIVTLCQSCHMIIHGKGRRVIGPDCPVCKSNNTIKFSKVPTIQGPKQRYRCGKCGKTFYKKEA